MGGEAILYLLLLLLLKLDVSISFHASLRPSPHWQRLDQKQFMSLNENDNERRLAKRDLFMEGLKLWKEYFESIRQWEIVEPSDTAFTIAMTLEFESIPDMLQKFKRDSWMFLVYPMIPDLIVEKIIELKIKSDKEAEGVVEFFLKHRCYRQLASLIALHEPPLTCDHFRSPSVNDLISVLEFLFKLKPEKVEEFIGPAGYDKMFMMAPLVACKQQDCEVVKRIIGNMAREGQSLQLIYQICAGFMFTEEYSKEIEIRNTDLATDFLPSIFKNSTSPVLQTAIKACQIMNMIKAGSCSEQQILLVIYLDESEESVKLILKILSKVANLLKNDHYRNLIAQYRLK